MSWFSDLFSRKKSAAQVSDYEAEEAFVETDAAGEEVIPQPVATLASNPVPEFKLAEVKPIVA